jgi:hypothetical protein
MISSDSTTPFCTWPAIEEMLVVDVLGLDEYRLPATRTPRVFCSRNFGRNPCYTFDNGSRSTVGQIYPSDKDKITEQVEAISQFSQSRDTSDVWP